MNNSDYSQTGRILLGVTAGIAAYKAVELARLMVKSGYQVQVVMTPAASHFVNELTFQSVTGRPVRQHLFDPSHEAAMGHIELARWADFILIAPTSADFIAKLCMGMADTLLHTLCLAAKAPIAIAPAMNRYMWGNSATRDNVNILRKRGIRIFGPVSGSQACGDTGQGRMLESTELLQLVADYFTSVGHKRLSGRKVLVTAGPTHEPFDPVRFIGNRSSGKMGFAVVQALLEQGAEVTLIAGPVNLATPGRCLRVDVQTAQQMYDAVMQYIPDMDIFISCAAVADYRPESVFENKIKKTHESLQINLVKNPDILQSVSDLPKPPFCLGFAAETNDLQQNAAVKRHRKKIDMVAANQVGETQGFDNDNNALLVLWEGGEKYLPKQPKTGLAKRLIELLVERFDVTTNSSDLTP